MLVCYNFIAHITYFFLKLISLVNPKMKLFISGRKKTFEQLAVIKKEDRVFWIHASSLGEFEQARPIIERLKKEYPNHKIVVSFFSPSGYEIRKDYALADVVCYLPFDTRKNTLKFMQQVHPEVALFIKYEFWPNLLNQLQKTNTKTLLVSGIFRKDQVFFKSYGKWMRTFLKTFDFFFVQNESSKDLLNSFHFENVLVSGDTRFDRVSKILEQNHPLDFIDAFKNKTYTVVAGSTWAEDEALLVNYINTKSTSEEKFIIAPHTINQKKIAALRSSIGKKTVCYSQRNEVNLADFEVFIIDTIGLLTQIYAYADVAYVGGGLATGLHNILEAATYGIPVIFGGNKHHKFNEALDLLHLGGSKTISTQEDFNALFSDLKADTKLRLKMGNIAGKYVQNNIGATQLVLDYLKQKLN